MFARSEPLTLTKPLGLFTLGTVKMTSATGFAPLRLASMTLTTGTPTSASALASFRIALRTTSGTNTSAFASVPASLCSSVTMEMETLTQSISAHVEQYGTKPAALACRAKIKAFARKEPSSTLPPAHALAYQSAVKMDLFGTSPSALALEVVAHLPLLLAMTNNVFATTLTSPASTLSLNQAFR